MQLVKISFKSDTIEVVDNLVSVNAICKNLGIDPNTQRQKIQSDETFQSEFKEIEINGITQRVLCIPYDKVNGWLFSINPNKVKPEVKQKLIEYKNECFDVLHDYFNKGYTMQPEAKEALELKIKQLQDTIMAQNRLIAVTPQIHPKTKLNPQDHNMFLDTAYMMIENIKELDEFSKHLEQRKNSMTNFLNALCDRYEFVKKYRDKKM